MKTLNIVGAGRLGRTLGRLWRELGQFQIQQVHNRSSAVSACAFIGAGQAVDSVASMKPADVWLIATPDADIASQIPKLSPLLSPASIVFHCSGALGSQVLKNTITPHTASIHPIHSFANPETSLHTFAGSFCGFEGDAEALNTLLPTFEALGAQTFAVDGSHKTLYHAASVMACNYLVALMDASLECFELAGVSRAQAQQMLLPITQQTLTNCLQASPEYALTGPVARGDLPTVKRQLEDLEAEPLLAQIYKNLGQQAVKVAARQDAENPSRLEQLNSLLSRVNPV